MPTNAPPGLRDVRGGRVSWCESGQGIPVVLLHGLGGSRIAWAPQLAGLGGDRRVVAWDAPGYGDSPSPDGPVTFLALTEAVVALFDELGGERVHLVGMSLGGMIAQYVAARHPDRLWSLSLLATSSRFGLDGTSPDEWRAARLAPLRAGRKPADFAREVLGAIAGAGVTDEALAQQCAAMARIPAAALSAAIDCLVSHDSQAFLGDITTPAQVLVGELDAETPVPYAQDLAQRIPGAVLHIVPGAGHLLHAEQPEVVNALLNGFFTAVEAASGQVIEKGGSR